MLKLDKWLSNMKRDLESNVVTDSYLVLNKESQ